MSLKAYEPTIEICLAHDEKAIRHLNEKERALFDHFIAVDPSDYMVDGKPQYQRLKLCAYKYSPFDCSLYIDVDTIWFPEKKVSDLIGHLIPYDFYIGKNTEHDPKNKFKISNYTYWENPDRIAKHFGLTNPIPQTVSGLFWFKKCDWCERLFKRCLEVYADKSAPCRKWANGKPDEYCFNVALSESNYKQKNSHFVYFDKINGIITRDQMYDNFWALAAGGNKLIDVVRSLYNDLVNIYEKIFITGVIRLHVDKVAVIKERRTF